MLFDPKWEVGVPPVEEPSWRERYMRAAENIERLGWCQGRLEDADGCVCVIQAMRMTGMTSAEVDRLCAYLGVRWTELAVWNDRRGRTSEQVIFALRDCARG